MANTLAPSISSMGRIDEEFIASSQDYYQQQNQQWSSSVSADYAANVVFTSPSGNDIPTIANDEYRNSKTDFMYTGGTVNKGTTKAQGAIGKQVGKDSFSFYEFQFNPNQFSSTFSSNWLLQNPAASIRPYGSFMFVDPTPLEFELFLDDTDNNRYQTEKRTIGGKYLGVAADLYTLGSFINPNVESVEFQADGKLESPSPVFLSLGPLVFKTIFNSVAWSITQWTTDLIPLRATASLKMTIIGDTQESNFTNLKKLQNSVGRSPITRKESSIGTYSDRSSGWTC